ncbi:MAG TPA: gamma-glutamyltransferase family protein [Steroidobacteraceae bacterium]|nr:gamma-glutamyltransferase family protein [Steroidobacteraceae bacterium]
MRLISNGLLLFGLVSSVTNAQVPPDPWCQSESKAPFCEAIRGVRAEGWPAQTGSEVMARNGMVVTSQPLAAQAGLAMLARGGNAVDAAIAAASTLSVVEPMMVGVAGDVFAVIYIAKEDKVYVLNASGTAPTGATIERFKKLGYQQDLKSWGPMSGMPDGGILTVTVPGSIWGWHSMLQRFGKFTFKETLESAAQYAENGFAVSQRIATDWKLMPALPLQKCCTELDPDSVKVWLPGGKPPAPGQIFRNPDLGRTLRLLQAHGIEVFYRGEIARAIVSKSKAVGGTMTLADLEQYAGEWVEPARSTYHGYELLELPPPSQAWATNEMLNILEACVPTWAKGQSLASLGPKNPLYWHMLVEAKKFAYEDLYQYNADPNFSKVPLARLLSKAHAESKCARFDARRASPTGPPGKNDMRGDTIVLSTADKDGNLVSLVNSNFDAFGSGLTVPGYGFPLHNRGTLFTLDPKSPNAIAPGKRPYNTLSAGMLMRAGKPVMTVTLMGGDMQAQGHAQMLVDIIDLGANLQAATDIARFRHAQEPNRLSLETSLFDAVGATLQSMGHDVRAVTGANVGGAQVIGVRRTDDGLVFVGSSDFRKDGQAAGW